MNCVQLIGRLTKDPEIYGQKKSKVAKYTLAVDRDYTNKDGDREADFIRCTVFGKAAEFVETYLEKGVKIGITGRIQTGQYEDEDGNIKYTTDVIVYSHEFCQNKKDEDEGGREGRKGRRK